MVTKSPPIEVPPGTEVLNAPPRATPAWPAQGDVPAFFGKIQLGDDGLPTRRWEDNCLVTMGLPYPMRLSWDTATTVRKITCHKAVQRDLAAILSEIYALYGRDMAQVRARRMDLYGGCYNFRRMRGLANLSMHSYGIAIDLDPERNPIGVKWKHGEGMMPGEVVDIFAAHGWTWGGLWRTRPDAMHFQSTQPL
jgi:hypothetical protein